jgi:tRNA (Thr-GGU) A37 N-methylase
MAPITLAPIGRVHSSRTEAKDDFWGNLVSVIELDGSRFNQDSILGLADFSHILVVYCFHLVPDASHPYRCQPSSRESGVAPCRHLRPTEERPAEQTWCVGL